MNRAGADSHVVVAVIHGLYLGANGLTAAVFILFLDAHFLSLVERKL